ncbi:MAG: hypothetical protein ABI036_14380 [Fibrobacteria bacterium]
MIGMKIDLKLSRNIALGIGPLLPLLETIRRIRIGGNMIWWLDDYLIGLFLSIFGLLGCLRSHEHGDAAK